MKKIFALVIIIMAFAAIYAIAQYSDLDKKAGAVVTTVAKEAESTATEAVTATEETATVTVESAAKVSSMPVPGAAPAITATQKVAATAVSSVADVTKAAASAVTAPVTAAAEPSVPAKKTFNVFTEKYDLKNHYIPSGWMGDYGDIQIDDGCTTTPHSGKTCFKIKYNAQGAQGAGWMGIYWQNPANNWGGQMGGYDLKGYKKLTFWARGEKGAEAIAEFKVGGINGNYADSDSTSIGPITLTKDWKEYTIDLKGVDLSYISGGFEFSASAKDNPEGFIIYLDDVKYEE